MKKKLQEVIAKIEEHKAAVNNETDFFKKNFAWTK